MCVLCIFGSDLSRCSTFQQPKSVFELLKAQMTEAAAAKRAGGDAAKKALSEASANFMRQFRDSESRELKKLTAQQFMEVWDHYDDDGE